MPVRLYRELQQYKDVLGQIREIHIRTNQRMCIIGSENEMISDEIVTGDDIQRIMEYTSGHSLYAYDEALKNGFITMPRGHRIGIGGQCVYDEKGIKCIKDISSLNIRVAHEKINCSSNIIDYIVDSDRVRHTLIISPPAYGKTTMLRDIVRKLSGTKVNNHFVNVTVIDERSEIGASYHGTIQNDLGSCTDVLDGCRKIDGIMMAVRTMSPDVVVVDELGLESDIYALLSAINCGCTIIATIHGNSIEDMFSREITRAFVDKKIFDRYIVLMKKCGKKIGIYDRQFELISIYDEGTKND